MSGTSGRSSVWKRDEKPGQAATPPAGEEDGGREEGWDGTCRGSLWWGQPDIGMHLDRGISAHEMHRKQEGHIVPGYSLDLPNPIIPQPGTCEHHVGVQKRLQRRMCGGHRLHDGFSYARLLQPDVSGPEEQLGHHETLVVEQEDLLLCVEGE